jgi:hypothetical protein
VLLEGLGKLKESSDLIGNRTRDLPAYSIVTFYILSTRRSEFRRHGQRESLEISGLCIEVVIESSVLII